jgi:CRISPR system Cascade subunit CasB
MPDDHDPGLTALSIAAELRRLDPGALSALRRMETHGAVPAYWHLAASHPPLSNSPTRWVPIVRAIAILTDKGAPERRRDLHDVTRPLGRALCDGGDPMWPGKLIPGRKPRPAFSERRLAHVLAARGRQRDVLLTRAIRALAVSRQSSVGLSVPEIALAFLLQDPSEMLAAPYYSCLDRAGRTVEPKEIQTDA